MRPALELLRRTPGVFNIAARGQFHKHLIPLIKRAAATGPQCYK